MSSDRKFWNQEEKCCKIPPLIEIAFQLNRTQDKRKKAIMGGKDDSDIDDNFLFPLLADTNRFGSYFTRLLLARLRVCTNYWGAFFDSITENEPTFPWNKTHFGCCRCEVSISSIMYLHQFYRFLLSAILVLIFLHSTVGKTLVQRIISLHCWAYHRKHCHLSHIPSICRDIIFDELRFKIARSCHNLNFHRFRCRSLLRTTFPSLTIHPDKSILLADRTSHPYLLTWINSLSQFVMFDSFDD